MKTIAVVGALLVDGNKFLVAQRAKGELAGYWEFPGGKIEEGETDFQAIEREIKEELGLTIHAQAEVSTFEHEYHFALIKLTLIKCVLKIKDESMVLDGSHLAVQWIDTKENDLTFAPLDQKIFKYITENNKTIFPKSI